MDKEYKSKVREELKRYDMSLKAFVLGYDSWFIGLYLLSRRIVEYYKCNHLIVSKLLIGGVNF